MAGSCAIRLACRDEQIAHEGCVNVARFSPSGQLLGTGSDDLHLGVWRPTSCTPLRELHCERGGPPESEVTPIGSSRPLLRPVASIPTGHTGNMFAVAFLPGREHLVATGAADGEVRLLDLDSGPERRLLRVWADAEGMVHDVCAVSRNVLFSASSDGTVRRRDVREPEQAARSAGATRNVVVSWPEQRITSMAASPIDPWLLAVAGEGRFVRVFDMRMSAAVSGAADAGARALGADRSLRRCVGSFRTEPPYHGSAGITGVRWSLDGRRIVANPSRAPVAVFDARKAWERSSRARSGGAADVERGPEDAGKATPRTGGALGLPPGGPVTHGHKVGLSGWMMRWSEAQRDGLHAACVAYGLIPADPAQAGDGSDDDGNDGNDGAAAETVGAGARLSRLLGRYWLGRRAAPEQAEPEGEEGETGEVDPPDEGAAFFEAAARAGGTDSVPGWGPAFDGLKGALNRRTVKEAAFLGPDSSVVVAGSDCGHLFAWELGRSSRHARPLRAWPADSSILNVVEPFRTSGHDPRAGSATGGTAGWGLVTSGIGQGICTWDLGGSQPRASPLYHRMCKPWCWLPGDPLWARRCAEEVERARAEADDEAGAMRILRAALKVFSDARAFFGVEGAPGPSETAGEIWPLFPLSSRPNRRLLGGAGPAAVFAFAALEGIDRAEAEADGAGGEAGADPGWDEDGALHDAGTGHALSPFRLRALAYSNHRSAVSRPGGQLGQSRVQLMALLRLMTATQ